MSDSKPLPPPTAEQCPRCRHTRPVHEDGDELVCGVCGERRPKQRPPELLVVDE